MADIGSLRPRLLIHGHTTLTEQFTAEAVPAAAAGHAAALDLLAGGRDEPRCHPHRPRRSRPRPADHPAGPAPPPRQHHAGRAAPHHAAPPDGAVPADRPVQVPHLRRTRRRRDRPRPVAARHTLAPEGSAKETTMHNDSSQKSDEAGHDAPGPGLRVRPPAHPVAAQDAGLDAARETGVVTKPSEGRGSAGLTERLAAASARRARRVLAAEVRK